MSSIEKKKLDITHLKNAIVALQSCINDYNEHTTKGNSQEFLEVLEKKI